MIRVIGVFKKCVYKVGYIFFRVDTLESSFSWIEQVDLRMNGLGYNESQRYAVHAFVSALIFLDAGFYVNFEAIQRLRNDLITLGVNNDTLVASEILRRKIHPKLDMIRPAILSPHSNLSRQIGVSEVQIVKVGTKFARNERKEEEQGIDIPAVQIEEAGNEAKDEEVLKPINLTSTWTSEEENFVRQNINLSMKDLWIKFKDYFKEKGFPKRTSESVRSKRTRLLQKI